MNNHRLDELISAKLTGILDEQGQKELDALLAQYPEQRRMMQQLEDFWQQKSAHEIPDAAVFDQLMEEAKTVPVRKLWPRWAAAAMIAGAIGLAGYYFNISHKPVQQQVQTMKGERRQFRLSDGSSVYLNADSRISYTFSNKSREIWLEGEAYFDVAKEADRPFTVHAGTLHIKALGTAFNVKAYQGDKELETTLLEGLVEVSDDAHPDKKIRLKPFEKIAFRQKEVKTIAAKLPDVLPVKHLAPAAENADSIIRETAWISNRLEFDMLRFDELATLLERWYGVKIIIQNSKAKDYVFSGSFATETIDQALTALQLTEDFSFEHKDTLIIIH
jgi:ferric-dicitrate binding protein FerR (iron transport regulator)